MRCVTSEQAQLLFIRSVQRAQCSNIHLTTARPKTHYEVLGLRQDASQSEIKNAFYTLSKKYHPDVARSRGDDASTTTFVAIKDAYDILRDPSKRRAYDEQISPSYRSDQYQYQNPFTHNQGPFDSPFSSRYRDRHSSRPPPRQSYTQAEYQRMFDEFRKRYESDAYKAFQEEFRQRAWEEQMRRRNEFVRQNSARFRSRGFTWQRPTDQDYSRFQFRPGPSFELLNKVLTIYLVVFFSVALTSSFYMRMGGFEWGSQSSANRPEDKREPIRRIDDMMAQPPMEQSSSSFE